MCNQTGQYPGHNRRHHQVGNSHQPLVHNPRHHPVDSHHHRAGSHQPLDLSCPRGNNNQDGYLLLVPMVVRTYQLLPVHSSPQRNFPLHILVVDSRHYLLPDSLEAVHWVECYQAGISPRST